MKLSLGSRPACASSCRSSLALLLALLPLQAQAGGAGGSGKAEVGAGVTRLDTSNWTEYMNNRDGDVLIEFFAPFCQACQSFAPTYSEAAALTKKRGVPATLAAIDTEANKKLAAHYKISKLPTLIFFPKGAYPTEYEKNAPRKPAVLVDWLEIMAGDAIKRVRRTADMPALTADGPPQVLLRAASVPDDIAKVANDLRQWARWFWLEEAPKEDGSTGHVELLHFGQEPIELPLPAEDDKLEEFFAANKNPQLTPVLNPKKFYDGLDSNSPGLLWVLLDGASSLSKKEDMALEQALTAEWRKTLKAVAGELALGQKQQTRTRKGYRILYLDARSHAEWVGSELYAFSFPQIVIQNRPHGERYHMPRGAVPKPNELIDYVRSLYTFSGVSPMPVKRTESPAAVKKASGKYWERLVTFNLEERLRSVPGTVIYAFKQGKTGERMQHGDLVLEDEMEALDDLAKWVQETCEVPPLIGALDLMLNEVPSLLVEKGYFSILSAPSLIFVPNDNGNVTDGYWGKKLRLFNSTKLHEASKAKDEEERLLKQDLGLLTKDLAGAADWVLRRAGKTPGLVAPSTEDGVSFWAGSKGTAPVSEWSPVQFANELKSKGIALVDFYLPGCGACLNFAPTFESTARSFRRQFEMEGAEGKVDITFAKMECDSRAGDAMATKYGVTGYPTLVFMRNGIASLYPGEMDKAGILEWITQEFKPDFVEVRTMNEAMTKAKSLVGQTAVVYQGDRGSGNKWGIFEATAKKLKHRYDFFAVEDIKGVINAEDVHLIRKNSQARFSASPLSKQYKDKAEEGLALWLAEGTARSEEAPNEKDQVGAVQVIVTKTMREKLFRADTHVILEVYAEWCTHCKQFAPIYEEFAEKMKKEKRNLLVGKLDGDKNEIPYQGFDIKGYPTLFYLAPKDRTPSTVKGRTMETLLKLVQEKQVPVMNETPDEEFAAKKQQLEAAKKKKQEVGDLNQDWLKGLRSEDLPDEDQEEAEMVKTAVLKNFAKVVFHKDQHTAVMFHDTRCPHCLATMPHFEEYAEELMEDEDNPDLTFAKFDGTKNDMPFQGFKAKGFPTIFFIKAGAKEPSESWVGSGCLRQLKAHISRASERDEL